MKLRFRLFCRASGVFYVENTETRQQESLQTKDKNAAQRLYQAKNAAFEQPALNMQLARTYMSASDPGVTARTWKDVYDAISKTKTGSTRNRWVVVGTDPAFGPIWERHILETRAEHLLGVLDKGGVSTNVFLRRLHNFAMDMNWLPWPIIPKKQWPAVIFSPKRAIRAEEHHRIIEIEWNPERRAFYELLWHFGGSQSDIACLQAENIDWKDRTISYQRGKTKVAAILHFSNSVEQILLSLPKVGNLFPKIATQDEKHRASEFKRRCKRLKIEGITLHSYRYSWAERAKMAGYPERYAMQALGHNSHAVHRAYARGAVPHIPSLEDYEAKNNIVNIPAQVAS